MAQNQDYGNKPVRQEWTPDWRLRLAHKIWSAVFTAAKVVAGAAVTVVLIGLVCCFVLVGVLADYLETDILPTASLVLEDYVLDAPSYVYCINADGQIEVLQDLYSSTDWKKAEYEEIPSAMVHAAVAIEDKRFYEHQGVDWVTTLKAFANMFFGSETVGGSSITQQLIKNKTEEDSVTVQRKVLEFFRAALVEKNYDKTFIIEEYLNSIYLGQGCRGVKSAAAAYFGKELQSLTIAECACLISITNNPSLFDPYSTEEFVFEGEMMNGKQRNRHRQLLVLGQLLAQEYITQEEYDEAVAQEMVFKSGIDEADTWFKCPNEECGYEGIRSTFEDSGESLNCKQCTALVQTTEDASQDVYSYFVDALLEQVARDMALADGITNWNDNIWKDYMDRISRGGYHIYATIDKKAQECVDTIYKDLSQIPETKSAQQIQSAIVLIDNKTGDIVAMSGGVGDEKVHFGLNRATQSKLQSGSVIKPLSIYGPAFEMGVLTPASVVKDLPLVYEEDGPYPRNDDRVYTYSRTIYAAIARSVNAVAAHSLKLVGIDNAFNYASNNFHLSTLDAKKDSQLAALALGAQYYGVTVSDMAAAFATFPNNGVYREARMYTKVFNSKGELILNNTQDSERALSEKAVNYMNYCLEYGTSGMGTGWQGKLNNMSTAAKTGSTSSFRDRWYCGYTSYYTAALWCGYDIPEQIYLAKETGNIAAIIWKKVMQPLHDGLENKSVYDQSKMVKKSICVDSGKIATEACKQDVRGSRVESLWLYPEDVPIGTCKEHVTVNYCKDCGCVASEYCLKFAEYSDVVIEVKSLVKMTQAEIDEILAAEDFGLEKKYLKNNYVYFITDDGQDGAFKGFHGDINQDIDVPYMICTKHTKEVWDAFWATISPDNPDLPTDQFAVNTP